jgi:argininosuccinate lyase
MRFAPEYVALVLGENFEDAKKQFLSPLMSIQMAHLVMLTAQRIISSEDAHALREALDAISRTDLQQQTFDGSFEDLFFLINRLVVERCGEGVAGRLHTARSRNDIDMTMYRMRQRDLILDLLEATLTLRRSLVELADAHLETVFAVHTHTQRAQPTTVAHYLLGVIEQIERDGIRLKGAFERTNRCPLGSCAITGTGFPIDRKLTADLLGFDDPTGNTFGSIATVDYLLESVSAATVLLVGLGRFVQDLLLWSASEFNYMRIGDGFVQCSSIMPQKRNPVALEHARAIASTGVGRGQAILMAVHNTPFGDIVDTEDDLQPLVFAAFDDASRSVKLVAAVMPTAEFDARRLEQRAGEGWTTLTELADTLVRDCNLPFATAHAVSTRLMMAGERQPKQPVTELLKEAVIELKLDPSVASRYTTERLDEILSPRHFVDVRRTPGGPAPSETSRAVAASRELLGRDLVWVNGRRDAIRAAAGVLAARSRAL